MRRVHQLPRVATRAWQRRPYIGALLALWPEPPTLCRTSLPLSSTSRTIRAIISRLNTENFTRQPGSGSRRIPPILTLPFATFVHSNCKPILMVLVCRPPVSSPACSDYSFVQISFSEYTLEDTSNRFFSCPSSIGLSKITLSLLGVQQWR